MAASMRELRDQAREYLGWENRAPERYDIDGIVRDAWINGNGSDEIWKAAVEKHFKRFLIGDWVRITVDVEDGFTEHHYGPIENFCKPDRNFYRRNVAKPYAAFVHPEHTRSHVVPLADLVEEINDFEITTEWSEVHRGGPQHNYGVYHCMGAHGPYPPPAKVMVIHKVSGRKKRFCDDCNTADYRSRFADEALMFQRNSKATILELRADPTLIAGPAADRGRSWEETPADEYRSWADAFPWLVPAAAAAAYTEWRDQQTSMTA
ncbi:hypothetical protein [Streptomyces sp. NBC_00439]|uniref:hypothetical protein n=1 Tax=Streptomyces sp. NBC_00439 TaxID=2903650 RepID=UPI002250345B|nr:hypothetical protein [Streptomyces sp. NBC_00439]MCX5103484.1 hypothetical protein [Streptomyces sp. NBC_00439]